MGIGDEFKELVFKRTGIEPKELVCPREKSDMTPCVARDGDCAMTDDYCCIGCGVSIIRCLQDEKEKSNKQHPSDA